MDTEILFQQIYSEMYRCMMEKDTETLSALMTEDFTLTHMTGQTQNRKEYLDFIDNGTFRYFAEKTEHITVECQEETAKLVGQSIVESIVYGGNRRTWRLQLALDFTKKEGQWLIQTIVASAY